MPHVNPDTLALLALGEDVATAEERAHLDGCPACRARIDEMADAAAVGRTVLRLERPATPPARVWAGVVAELGLPADLAPTAVLERSPGEPARARRRAPRRRLLLALAAAVVLLAAGTAVTV